MAMAQTGDALDVAQERSRIAQARTLYEQRFTQAEQACYQRFAVFDCLHQARKERRLSLDELRRQDIVLNELERKRNASAALERIQRNVTQQEAATPTR